MMHRTKITHCAAIIANLYGTNYPYICKDKNDTYIEVKTEEEAATIEAIEYEQSKTFEYVELLKNILQS